MDFKQWQNQQTFSKSRTAPFDYDLYDVMPKLNKGDIIKDNRGKQWRVVGLNTYTAQYDTDSYFKSELTGETFATRSGKTQKVTVIEHYPRLSFQNLNYRLQYKSFSIRVS